MKKKPPLNSDDVVPFDQLMRGVKPLKQKNEKIDPYRTSPKIRIQKPLYEFDYDLTEIDDLPSVSGSTMIAHKKNGISNKILRKLRKGQYNIEAKLDLHGMSVETAKSAVESFLQKCMNENYRVVLIVHGKGTHSDKPILKNKLNLWLRSIEDVLVFCSAAATHGSSGAVYIMLKRR